MSTSAGAVVTFIKIRADVSDLDFDDEVQEFVNKFNSETCQRLKRIDTNKYTVFYDRVSHFDTEDIKNCLDSFECLKIKWELKIYDDGTDPSYLYECTSTYIKEISSEDDELDNLSEIF